MDLLRRLRTTRLDAALAVVFTVLGLVQQGVAPLAEPAVGVLYVVGSTLPLAWRRTLPVPAALVSAAFWLVPLVGYPVLGFVVVVLQFFALGERVESSRAFAATVTVASAASVIGTLLGPEVPVAAIGAVLVVAAPALAGRLMRHQRRQNLALVELTEELAAERSRAEAAAVGAERARIAQELHDVVGHELTLIAIQAEAAASALRVSPDRAVDPVEAIRATAHRTLGEIREVLQLLAPDGEDVGPGAESIADVAERARAAGIANSLSVSGTPASEHAPVSMAVSRIVRECLTNAGRHAPGQPVQLDVRWQPDRVSLTAVNAARHSRPPVAGRGLTGIRHRAELLGGTFDVSHDAGRFAVSVTIPAGGAA
ncbi:sensor histidine kinase [Angustibacter sp. Root456]|uniref:sensor histidine kinase n=1 Tax=Angustibacter sp. Root456 TaxID=1736539 RepID=UPI0006FCCBE2|nr:histidine kinase [Angustibacter sp. Root456]KQX62890.1 hypothetical protein ASD06_12800 [Angustibacter sp. Root456]